MHQLSSGSCLPSSHCSQPHCRALSSQNRHVKGARTKVPSGGSRPCQWHWPWCPSHRSSACFRSSELSSTAMERAHGNQLFGFFSWYTHCSFPFASGRSPLRSEHSGSLDSTPLRYALISIITYPNAVSMVSRAEGANRRHVRGWEENLADG